MYDAGTCGGSATILACGCNTPANADGCCNGKSKDCAGIYLINKLMILERKPKFCC